MRQANIQARTLLLQDLKACIDNSNYRGGLQLYTGNVEMQLDALRLCQISGGIQQHAISYCNV